MRAKESRTQGGPIEPIDPAEFTRVRPLGVHAVHERTKKFVWYDLRVFAEDLLKIRQSNEAHSASSTVPTPSPLLPRLAADADIEAAVRKFHPRTAAKLKEAVQAALAPRVVSGNRVAAIRNRLFGPPGRIGRPPRPK